MVHFKKKSQTLLLLILIIIFSINTNFFRNLYEVILHKFDNRITKKYDYCIGESIGYLLHIKKKYQINDNPKIINYVHTPHVIWSIINTKQIDQNSNKLILLNYPGPNLIKSLDKINNNLFELNDAYFLSDKFSEIKNLKILDTPNNNKKVSFVINIYTIDKFRNKKNIKTLKVKDKFDIRSKINLDMNLKDLNLTEKKLYFEIKDSNNTNSDNLKIKIILKNKYTLENFKIINKIDNCYYLEQV
jgi:hypothetical protein